MKLKIVQAGEPVLRQQARELSRDEIRDRATQELIEWMRQTMYDAPGVGLAAPQVGLRLQLAVIEDKPEYIKAVPPDRVKEMRRQAVPFHVIVNPKITLDNGSPVEFFEGCLSLTGLMALVPRAPRVRVDCLDHNGDPKHIDATGWHARILQHEIDHLQGGLYIDRMYSRSLMQVDQYNRHWKDKSIPNVKNELGID
ncbi:MAG TPA: peptide deformylase [Bryobacteraceae bacterium]|jgi:peptide deformylase|nr:peptide deformylase [Bryobacteraceae bacterium]